MTKITKEMNVADLAAVTGGGWKINIAIGGLCLASGPIGTLVCVVVSFHLIVQNPCSHYKHQHIQEFR